MNVFMLRDVEKIGMTGQVVKVADGYANNFLFPRKLAIKVTNNDMKFYDNRVIKKIQDKDIINSKSAMLAERLKNMHFSLKEKTHDDGKLYGAIGAEEIVTLLKKEDIAITKKQVVFEKSIKTTGEHKVTIKLSSKLLPQITVKVVAEKK